MQQHEVGLFTPPAHKNKLKMDHRYKCRGPNLKFLEEKIDVCLCDLDLNTKNISNQRKKEIKIKQIFNFHQNFKNLRLKGHYEGHEKMVHRMEEHIWESHVL